MKSTGGSDHSGVVNDLGISLPTLLKRVRCESKTNRLTAHLEHWSIAGPNQGFSFSNVGFLDQPPQSTLVFVLDHAFMLFIGFFVF